MPGGGVTLVNVAAKLKAEGSDSIAAGRAVLKKALEQPFLQIMKNAGFNADALLAQVQAAKPGQGVDVAGSEAKLVDVKAKGVVDPTRVTKEAVQNAVSIAATAITMGALVIDIPEKESPAPGGGGMGGGMGF